MTRFSRILFEARFKEEILPDGTVRTENENSIYYTKDGNYHRIGGPAVIGKKTGVESYYVNGRRHRIGGPAIISKNEFEEYWVNGKCHRIDGPAVIDSETGEEEYFVNGKKLSKEEFHKHFGDK